MHCHNCDEELRDDQVRWAFEEPYCEDCFDNMFNYCCRCDGVIYRESAHYNDEGDPYLAQIEESVRLIMQQFTVPHHLSFQSRAGPVKWLEPSTDDMLKKLAGSGVKNLLVVPLSFVSDHIETLHEIDIEYSKKAWELGIAKFERMPSLNSSPRFIEALAALVLKGA